MNQNNDHPHSDPNTPVLVRYSDALPSHVSTDKIEQLLIGAKADLHAKDDRGRTALKYSNNRRCKERIREAERREERAAEAQRQLMLQQKRDKALRRRERELLDRVDLRSRVRTPGGM